MVGILLTYFASTPTIWIWSLIFCCKICLKRTKKRTLLAPCLKLLIVFMEFLLTLKNGHQQMQKIKFVPNFRPTQISRGRGWGSACQPASVGIRTCWKSSDERTPAKSWAQSSQSPSRWKSEKIRPGKKFRFSHWTFFGCLKRGCYWAVTNPMTWDQYHKLFVCNWRLL